MVLITSVWFEEDNIFVEMSNGQIFCKPVKQYKNLDRGTKDQLTNYKIEGNGRWIHWEELDEDLSAEGFLSDQQFV